MNKKHNILSVSIGLFALSASLYSREKPNILLILIDDLGYPAVSCYGNKLVETPYIDRIAREGVRFTSGYVCPQSTPTRACLITGQYGGRNRMWHVIPKYGFPYTRIKEPEYLDNLPREQFTLAEALKSGGYTTACIGKWHLSTYENDGYYTYLYPEKAHFYGFDYVNTKTDPSEYQSYGDKGVDFLTKEAIGFMEKNTEKPFFIYLSHHTIHNPVLAPDELVKTYREEGYPDNGLNQSVYLAAIRHLDNSVGLLLDALEKLDIEKNTIVLFISDNGGVDAQYDNYPLRYGKGSPYEGGIRVPFIVKWPGITDGGLVEEAPVHIVDIYPTLLKIAGIKKPSQQILDGRDISPLLIRQRNASSEFKERAIYFYQPLYDIQWGATPSASILENGFKLIHFFGDYIDLDNNSEYIPEGRTELYYLKSDIGESEDLSQKRPDIALKMKKKLDEWIRSQGAEEPVLNPDFDINRWRERTNQK